MRTRSPQRFRGLLLGLLLAATAAPAIEISDIPPFLISAGVEPNILLTIDDSGSMSYGYAPDQRDSEDFEERYFKSSDYNGIYYDPETLYTPPSDSDGNPLPSSSDTSTPERALATAYRNGYEPDHGTRDLTDNYRPTRRLSWRYGNRLEESWMPHYSDEVYVRRYGDDDDDDDDDYGGRWSNDVRAYYYRFEPGNRRCNGELDDNDCYTLVQVDEDSGPDGSDERRNFANWYAFYRSRNLATMTAATLSFARLDDSARVAWQTLNQCPLDSYSNCRGTRQQFRRGDNRIDTFSGTHRENFFDWVSQIQTNGGTPLRPAMQRAGDYFTTSAPYEDSSSGRNRESHGCRRNFHIMMTDGIWNSKDEGHGNNFSGATNATNRNWTLPDGTKYQARPPYEDAMYSATISDLAFYYWATDLRRGSGDRQPDCTGATCDKVPVFEFDTQGDEETRYWNPRNDPATWQHMTNFTVGLGLGASMIDPAWGGSTYGGDYQALLAGSKSWPSFEIRSYDPLKVYDLWHAAINSRGRFYSAEDPASLTAAFEEIIGAISSTTDSGTYATPTANGEWLNDAGTAIFTASFNADWSGDVVATSPAREDAELWRASQRQPAPYARRIFTTNGAAGATAFDRCNGALGAALGADCTRRLAWLRGDGRIEGADCSRSSGDTLATFTVKGHPFSTGDQVVITGVQVEDDQGPVDSPHYNGRFRVVETTADTLGVALQASSCNGVGSYHDPAADEQPRYGRIHDATLRDRATSQLGDVLNADPIYSGATDQGYGATSSGVSGKDGYAAYLRAKERRLPMLYVGANDGMLHGFRADLDDPASGRELFAYVPYAVYHDLDALPEINYQHRPFVDGPLTLGDAHVGDAWRTYLAGALGGGGRGVFLLDVSDPETFDADDVIWEFTDADDRDLGLTYSAPQIAATAPDHWALIFGNGYNSDNGRAVLYLVSLGGKSDREKITLPATAGDNGLSSPALHDANNDGIVDRIYVGDLQGNLWKLERESDGDWAVATDAGGTPAPLFIATDEDGARQPITARPAVVTSPEGGGVIVYVGTGRYLSQTDITDTQQQSFYVIFDKDEGRAGLERADLIARRTTETVKDGRRVKTFTAQGTVSWMDDRGWYLDLDHDGRNPAERFDYMPNVQQFSEATSWVTFITKTPSNDPCDRGGHKTDYTFSLITGDLPDGASLYDINDDGSFDSGDRVGGDDGSPVIGVVLDPQSGFTKGALLMRDESGHVVTYTASSTGNADPDDIPRKQGQPPYGGQMHRIDWRQLL